MESLSLGEHYGPDGTGTSYRFHLVMDTFQTDRAEKDFHKLTEIRLELQASFKELLQFIRNNYLEIDLEETSKKAFESYEDMEKSL